MFFRNCIVFFFFFFFVFVFVFVFVFIDDSLSRLQLRGDAHGLTLEDGDRCTTQ